ncbi:hypothetical protein ABZY68_08300 [Streptomyces sp. NPDC006482]|uniref:hypothetical protein n=1 Tax=Streptomyces sp. NPDC006482 TaxID=3154306 RepID=UPI0033B865E7
MARLRGGIDTGGTSEGSSCEQLVLRRTLDDLSEAAARDMRITRSRDGLETALHESADAVRPRAEYGLIRGERRLIPKITSCAIHVKFKERFNA